MVYFMKSEQIDNFIVTINMGTDVNKLVSLVFGFEIPQKFFGLV